MKKTVTLGLALLGLFDSLYLLWAYTSPSRPMVCLGTGSGCDAVRASSYSSLRGVPMPVFGVAGYLLLAILIVAEPLVSASSAKAIRYALAGMTSVGFLFSIYLEYLQGFVIHAFCAWCVTSGVVMTALCGLAVHQVFRPGPEPEPPAQLAEARHHLAICVVGLLVGVPAFYRLARHGELRPSPPVSDAALGENLVRADSHMAGNPHASVTVVEFGDFECPACGREEETAREIRKKYANQIRFVFRQFPLVHIHTTAERAAEASECAAEQGKFWEAVDKIYSRQFDESDAGLRRDAAEIGLDLNQFDACLANTSTAARVRRDLADGTLLGVVATPTFFVGRKKIEDVPSTEELSQLIDRELASPGKTPLESRASHAASAPGEPKTAPHPAVAGKSDSGKVPTEPSPPSFGSFGPAPGGIFATYQKTGGACSEAEAAKKQPTQIDSDELGKLLAAGTRPLFVDVRPAKEFAAGNIPGALNLPVDDLDQRWSLLPKDRVIVLYESGRSSGDICAASRAAGRTLLERGFSFDHVKVYQDGLAGWEKSGLSPSK